MIVRALTRIAVRSPLLRTMASAAIPRPLRRALHAHLDFDATADHSPQAYQKLLAHAEPMDNRTSGRIVMVCGSLAPGGAERQLVNTLRGLAAKGYRERLLLLSHRLTPDQTEQHDFYLPTLKQMGVEAREIARKERDWFSFTFGLPKRMNAVLRHLPPHLMADVADLYREFLALKPSVVHAWLDWSNVRAGLAAALTGVPRIILSGRNVNPTHFFFNAPYFHPVYLALIDRPNVIFVNNSEAGAADYADWLRVPRKRISVIRNGIDFPDSARPSLQLINEFRHRIGIPPTAPLVGGIFRFSPEKRPNLWIETAAVVAAQRPDCRFVLIGQGPLRKEMAELAAVRGLKGRLAIRGVTDSPLVALASFNVCLLTSAAEGTPNIALESQWVGTPVVATHGGGTCEAVEVGATGWIVDRPDPIEIANMVLQLIADDTRKTAVAERGPAFVRSRYGLQRMIDETLKIYHQPEVASIRAGDLLSSR
jgi:glycosyltransferase involved in cell wall biosynthesis